MIACVRSSSRIVLCVDSSAILLLYYYMPAMPDVVVCGSLNYHDIYILVNRSSITSVGCWCFYLNNILIIACMPCVLRGRVLAEHKMCVLL